MKNLQTLEIRKNAKQFSEKWKNERYEKGETHSFYDEFFRVFGNERYGITQYEKRVDKFGKSGGYIDLFYPGVLLAEQKSAGKNLKDAKRQADDLLKEEEKPRYILACDFQNFHLYDSINNTEHKFKLSQFHENIHLFEFLQNIKQKMEQYYIKLNTKVTESMGRIFTSLRHNDYDTPHVERLLTRITFCMFAEDVGIFNGRSMFQKFIENNTSEHGGDLGEKLRTLFEILGQEYPERQKDLGEEYAQFPYINGDLFKDEIKTPVCDKMIRDRIIDACKHEWTDVSPVIFGSMFQTIMSDEDRHNLGAHYTSEENILKVIRPLFLDGLWMDFKKIKERRDGSRKKELEKFHNKLSELAFFDPACGAGNFLIIAYRELRRLETDVLLELRKDRVLTGDASKLLSKIKVSQFYGIELMPFSAQIAQTALWMIDHKMNLELGDKFGESYILIPLGKSPNIKNCDALEIDWNDVLKSNECSYVFGNPPYRGARVMKAFRKSQTKKITGSGDLDYVSNWFIKSAQYVNDNTPVYFVATNSITQGDQVTLLWKQMYEYGMDIIFAHTSFKWTSEASDSANVTVVIIGMSKKIKQKKLFDGTDTILPKFISPYLFGTDNKPILLISSDKSINGLGEIKTGTQPIDDHNYIFNNKQKVDFLKIEPNAEKYLYPFMGGKEFINKTNRWILVLKDLGPEEGRQLPEIKKRIEAVRKFREQRNRSQTIELSKTPRQFSGTVIPTDSFLVIPQVSSENRSYIPIGYLSNPIIPSDKLRVIENASLGLFGLLTSKMHMVWINALGGKLEASFSYSNTMYNIFPPPKVNLDVLDSFAQNILDIREEFNDSSLDTLYNIKSMPEKLLKAHEKLDRAVEKLYRKEPFKNDRERLKFLIEKYQKTINTVDSGPGTDVNLSTG